MIPWKCMSKKSVVKLQLLVVTPINQQPNSMTHDPPWKVNNYSADEDILYFYRTTRSNKVLVYHSLRIQLKHYFSKLHFNIILPSHLVFQEMCTTTDG
jgi:hypothetical protein